MTHPPNVMPEELQVAHYIKQILELEALNAELLAALKMAESEIANTAMLAQVREIIAHAEGW